MAKAKILYSCTECGGQTPKWQGQCPHCGEWNTLGETVAETGPSAGKNRYSALAASGQLQQMAEVEEREGLRTPTGITEVARVLGGGLAQRGAVLIGRAYAYGLAAGGAPGVARAIEILRADLERTLKLLGCPSVAALGREYLTGH